MKKKGRMKFDLSKNEIKSLDKFIEEVPDKYKDRNLEIIFTLSLGGIGTGVTEKKGKFQRDITDYARW